MRLEDVSHGCRTSEPRRRGKSARRRPSKSTADCQYSRQRHGRNWKCQSRTAHVSREVGVVFVSVGGIWILLVCVGVLIYYLSNLSLPPPLASGQKPDDYKSLLDLHKTAGAQFQDSVVFVFDLMVTKTILPLLTLLLGYLFGAKKSQ